jgi:hypothetical protein
MTTITINTYDPAGRFDFDSKTADRFFKYVAEQAEKAGYDVDWTNAIQSDDESERFVEGCFQEWGPTE